MTFDEIYQLAKSLISDYSPALIGQHAVICAHISGKSGGKLGIVVNNGAISINKNTEEKCDASFFLSESDFFDILNGKLNPISAFFSGKVKIAGDIQKAAMLKYLKFKK